MLIYGRVKFEASTVIETVIAISFASWIINNPEAYVKDIVHPLTTFIVNVSSFFISTGDNTPESIISLFKSLDLMFDKIVLFADHLRPKGGLLDFSGSYLGSYLALGVLLFAYGLMYFCFLIIMAISIVSVYILHVVSFFCIMCAVFKNTRQFFTAWLKSLCTYYVTIVFASIVMGIVSYGLTDSFEILMATDTKTGPVLADVLMIVSWCLLAFVGLLKSQEWAASITGGMGSSTTGVTAGLSAGGSAAMATGRMSTSPIGSGYKHAKGYAKSGINSVFQSVRERRGL